VAAVGTATLAVGSEAGSISRHYTGCLSDYPKVVPVLDKSSNSPVPDGSRSFPLINTLFRRGRYILIVSLSRPVCFLPA
jgi:hypothetical protein